MEILSNDEFSDIIEWLPHGEGFVIHNRKRFASEVLPLFFGREIKYASFTRRMKRWSFCLEHHAAQKKNSSYYTHPLFSKNDAEKCLRMRPKPQRQFKKKTGSTVLTKTEQTPRRNVVNQILQTTTTPSPSACGVLVAPPPRQRILSSGPNISNYVGNMNVIGQDCHGTTSAVTLEPPYMNFNRVIEQQLQLRPGQLYDYDLPMFAPMPTIAGFNQPALIQQPQHFLSQPRTRTYQLGFEPNYPYSW